MQLLVFLKIISLTVHTHSEEGLNVSKTGGNSVVENWKQTVLLKLRNFN